MPIRRRVTIRRLFLALLAIFLVIAALDYASYQVRHRRAISIVANLGGRAGSLMGWPLGKEIIISFARPLTDDELRQLSVLNSLPRRDYVNARLRRAYHIKPWDKSTYSFAFRRALSRRGHN
jgi:hypothetical protein